MKRFLITLPDEWHSAFSERAEQLGESLSEYMRIAAAERLTKKERDKLPEIGETRGRPPKSD